MVILISFGLSGLYSQTGFPWDVMMKQIFCSLARLVNTEIFFLYSERLTISVVIVFWELEIFCTKIIAKSCTKSKETMKNEQTPSRSPFTGGGPENIKQTPSYSLLDLVRDGLFIEEDKTQSKPYALTFSTLHPSFSSIIFHPIFISSSRIRSASTQFFASFAS